jgi:hypothetical protein
MKFNAIQEIPKQWTKILLDTELRLILEKKKTGNTIIEVDDGDKITTRMAFCLQAKVSRKGRDHLLYSDAEIYIKKINDFFKRNKDKIYPASMSPMLVIKLVDFVGENPVDDSRRPLTKFIMNPVHNLLVSKKKDTNFNWILATYLYADSNDIKKWIETEELVISEASYPKITI